MVSHVPVFQSAALPYRVTSELDDWPEKGRRELRWCPAATAAPQLDEPMVADLCRRLAA